MPRQLALALAVAALAIHLAFIAWVVLGALLTRGRRRLAGLHVVSLVYGIVIEAGPWPCPLTLAENWFEAQAGVVPYRGPFLVHYLDAVVYPNVSVGLLVWAAVAVAFLNGWIYLRRWRCHSAAFRSRSAAAPGGSPPEGKARN